MLSEFPTIGQTLQLMAPGAIAGLILALVGVVGYTGMGLILDRIPPRFHPKMDEVIEHLRDSFHPWRSPFGIYD